MKNYVKMLAVFALFALLVLTVTACGDTTENDPSPTQYVGETMAFDGHQVWSRNYETKKISNIHFRFEGNCKIAGIVELPYHYPDPPVIIQVGEGTIENGILSFTVEQPATEKLLKNGEDILYFIFREWWNDDDGDGFADTISIDPPDVRGNIATLVSGDGEFLNWEFFAGTKTSLSGEYVWFIYVDKPCTITSETVVDTDLHYTFNQLHLTLNAGWNTLCKKETYTTTGNSSYSFTIKKPNFTWVIFDDPAAEYLDLQGIFEHSNYEP